MGVVIPALSDNGFVNITLAMKDLSDDRLKKGLSPKKLNDIIKYDGFQEKCREIISRLENRDLCKRINISLQNKALNLSDLNKMGLVKIFSGPEVLALDLKGRIEAVGINVELRNNNQANVFPSLNNNKAVEVFIQENDFMKVNNVVEEFKMGL